MATVVAAAGAPGDGDLCRDGVGRSSRAPAFMGAASLPQISLRGSCAPMTGGDRLAGDDRLLQVLIGWASLMPRHASWAITL